MNDRYLPLARHAAAVLKPDEWRVLTELARELAGDMRLDDEPTVALALERAALFMVLFNTRIGPGALATLH